MKRKELKEVITTYCDFCGKNLSEQHSHRSIKYEDGLVVHFCSPRIDDITQTCIFKAQVRNIRKVREEQS